MHHYEPPYNTMSSQNCWAPKVRYQSIQRKPIEMVIPQQQQQFLQPREYTYPKPSPERKSSKIEIEINDHDKTLVTKEEGHCCEGCRLTLSGQVLTTATNKYWHSKCFQCQTCHIRLEHMEYYEQDGKPYCALDFHELFSPRCGYCKTPIEADRKIIALGKSYHVGHAFCRECEDPFKEDDRIIEKDGYGYCENDYNKLFAKMCKGCGEYISEGFIKALGSEWHTACFVCVDCGSKFTSLTFQLKGGKPYCGNCPAHKPRRERVALGEGEKICHGCQKPILGRCHTAFGKHYHPIHFQCSCCEKILSARLTGLFEEDENGEIICKPCHHKK